MKTRRIILAISALLISVSALSAPARKGLIPISQPDGTTFNARIKGDEFMKIMTTAEGHSIIKEKDGWWCYAHYDTDGVKFSSGYRVGSDTPADVVSRSRNIPYNTLAAKAQAKRSLVRKETEPLMSRVMKRHGAATKGGDSGPVTKHGLIILAQFQDVSFTHTYDDFADMLTREGYNANGATGSAKEYFDDQFNGAIKFVFDVSPIVTLPQNMAFYGKNNRDGVDRAPEEMVVDACNLVDDVIDFSLYDDDGDGLVDNVFIFFAGNDEAEVYEENTDCIWSHSWDIYEGAQKDLVLDGKRIDRYACTAELSRRYTTSTKYRDVLAGIGTFCHEYFHTFGIPDLYDSDYEASDGTAAGMWGATSLMDSGNQNNYGNTPPNLNAVERDYLGISEPEVIKADGGYRLEPVNIKGQVYRLNTDHVDEYYLLECRENTGWDKQIGGSGMLVYHIDKSDRRTGYSETFGENLTARERWGDTNEVNCRPDHQCADLIEADRRKDGFSAFEDDIYYSSLQSLRGIFFPWTGNNSMTAGEESGLTFWSGSAAKASITNILKDDSGVSFNVTGLSGDTQLPPEIASIKAEAFTDAAIILFESDREYEGEATVTWGRTGSEEEVMPVKPYEPGKYSVTLEGLQPNNKTYTVKVRFDLNGFTGKENSISFMTKKVPSVKWPFLYMGGAGKNEDGTMTAGSLIPLRVGNAGSAAEIRWEFNGTEIKTDGSGYFKVESNGTLKARITWQNGSEETIMKEIITEK